LVKRMRFTPSKVHDGKILVSVDLSEINSSLTSSACSAAPRALRGDADRPVAPAGKRLRAIKQQRPPDHTLKARVETLRGELAKVEHRQRVSRLLPVETPGRAMLPICFPSQI
jgi:hypothetical protein